MLARDGCQMGGPVSGRPAHARPVIETMDQPRQAADADRAADHRAALHAPVWSAPDRVLPPAGPVNRRPGPGSNHVIDDHSRLVYSEILGDEKKETVIGFWRRAIAFFADAGITFERLMTDNGPAYRSRAFAAELGPIP